MQKHNANNERIKRKYLIFLNQAKRQNEASVDSVAKAIARFESYNKYKDFKMFHFEQAIGFKKHLANQKHHKTGNPLSLATMNGAVRHLKAFIEWLSQETGYKSRIKYSDAEYFNLSEKDVRVATAKRNRPVPTLEQIKKVISVMPAESVIERRNRALVAFTALTGARDSAIASFKLKHINLDTGSVFQDAREMNTKASKTFTTHFFPVGDEVQQIICDWVLYLRQELLFGNDDPVFPKTEVRRGDKHVFEPVGVMRSHWSNTTPIRKVFREAFELAGLPYFNPHSFRKTLVQLGESLCQGPEEFKAWSQNLGHEGVMTTFYSYGNRQAEIFKSLKNARIDAVDAKTKAMLMHFVKEMKSQGDI